MSGYKQLTYEQRCQIEVLKRSGFSQQQVADALGVNQSSISRELCRNRGERGYRHKQAHGKAVARRVAAVVATKMKPTLINQIVRKVREHWSPEQISGWLLDEHERQISHESIYLYIWADKRVGGDLFSYLRRRGKRYQWRGSNGKTSRGQIKNRVSIDDRPLIVDEKVQVGHWEIDTVIGKGHKGVLVTIVERVTQFTRSCRVPRKSAVHVTAATIALLKPFKALVLSITADNGKEFAHHEEIAKSLDCKVYFAHPYCSWERGLNENTNGLLRQYFPKQTNFNEVEDKMVSKAIRNLNNRPRKLLAFKTPEYLMQQHMAALAA
ncbi:MAG: IS30 family transposase [Gammaproteobacteria bacterium]|nr:IS30 family transposase [Gammaproteobacteria bacterium]